VDHYRNLLDVARFAVSSGRPAIEAKSFSTNGAASAGQHEPSSPFTSGQITNQAARRNAIGRQDSPLGRRPLDIMKSSISLSDEQVRKLEPVFKEQQDKMNALRRDASLSRKDRMVKLKEIQQGTDSKIKAQLAPEQAEKWQKMRVGQGQPLQVQGQGPAMANTFSPGLQAEKGQQGLATRRNRIPQPQQPQQQPPEQTVPK
jgi:hypothetical protein